MAATVSYANVISIFDGAKRVRQVTLTVTGTVDASESLSANSCGLNTIDAVIGGPLFGTVANVTNKCLLAAADATGATTALLKFYAAGTTNQGLGLYCTTDAATNTVSGKVIVVGN